MASIEQVLSPVDALQEKSASDVVNDGLQDRKQEALTVTPWNVEVLPVGGEALEEEEKIPAYAPAAAATSDELIARELDTKAEIKAAEGEAVAPPGKETEEEAAAAVPKKGTEEESAEEVASPTEEVVPVEPVVSDEPPPTTATEEDGEAKTAEEVPSQEEDD